MSIRIIIIEDDPELNANVKNALVAEKYSVDAVFDGQIELKLLQKNKYDCVILDINLSIMNGFEICKSFSDFNTHTPIIMLPSSVIKHSEPTLNKD